MLAALIQKPPLYAEKVPRAYRFLSLFYPLHILPRCLPPLSAATDFETSALVTLILEESRLEWQPTQTCPQLGLEKSSPHLQRQSVCWMHGPASAVE